MSLAGAFFRLSLWGAFVIWRTRGSLGTTAFLGLLEQEHRTAEERSTRESRWIIAKLLVPDKRRGSPTKAVLKKCENRRNI